MTPRILLAACVAMFAGCASRDVIRLEYTPMSQVMPGLAAKTFNVSVDDQRTYEWRQRQPSSYLGTVRGAGGASHVFNDGDRSFGDQLRKDLRRELLGMGLVETHESPRVRIRVRVLEWNFQPTTPTRYRYVAEIAVADTRGRVIESSMIQDEKEIGGNPVEGASQFYAGFIHRLIRENPGILAALERGS
jgi:hypothetical protein